MSNINKFIEAFETQVDTQIVSFQKDINEYNNARQSAVTLTYPFVVNIPSIKVSNDVDRSLPELNTTNLGQLFDWLYPISGPENTNPGTYITRLRILEKSENNSVISVLENIKSVLKIDDSLGGGKTLNETLKSKSNSIWQITEIKKLKSLGGTKWFDIWMRSVYSIVSNTKITVSKLKKTEYSNLFLEFEGILESKFLSGYYYVGSRIVGSKTNQPDILYDAVIEAGDNYFGTVGESTQSNTIGEYNISVKSPKTDSELRIEGKISFTNKGDKIIPNAVLNGLPNPWTNSLSNKVVENNTGSITYQGTSYDSTSDITKINDLVIIALQDSIISKYGILHLQLQYSLSTNTTTPSDSDIIAGTTQSTTTPSITPPKEYIFNVEQSQTFFNTEIGLLTIISKQDNVIINEPTDEDSFIFGIGSEDLLDEEYEERDFSGGEEETFDTLISTDYVDTTALNNIKGYDPEKPDPLLSTDGDSKYKIPTDKTANIAAIKKAMISKNITNKFTQAAILAVVSKETAFVPRNEASYATTSATRIKSIFKRLRSYSDSEVDSIKKTPKRFFDIIYGGLYENAADEGYTYRGRGFNQVTFKSAYRKMKKLSGYDIVSDPDLLNKIEVASACLVEYFIDRFKGIPSDLKSRYNTSGNINDFKTLNDAVGAIYHANAGWGNSYSLLVTDTTGGRKKTFNAAPTLFNSLA